MDTIKNTQQNINAFNDKINKSGNIVLLKRINKTEHYIYYVVVRATEEEINKLKINKQLERRQYQFLIDEKVINFAEEIEGIIFSGHLLNFTSYEQLVFQYPMRKIDIRDRKEKVYKDYSKTKEEQENIQWLVNSTPTPLHSWKTVIRKIGKTGIILKIKKEKK